MKSRLVLLLILLASRCILGWFSILRFDVTREVVVKGKVINVYRKDSECIMIVGKFLVNSGKICAAKIGDKIEVFGTFERRLIDSFGGRLWLVSKQIDNLDKTQKTKRPKTQSEDWLSNFRESLVNTFKNFVPEPEAGLLSGVVLGYKKDIGQEFYQQMIKSGSIHIAVASGYNILLVGGTVLSLSFWLTKRKIAIWMALGMMIFYAALAGGEPPVVRAVWMAGLMYLGQSLGRGSISWWILTLTVWMMLMIDPTLIANASFQLSVAASYGLIVVEPRLSRWVENGGGQRMSTLTNSLGILTTISTMLLTMPIIWWHFGRMSLIGILSNILILPFIPPLMILGVLTLIVPGLFAWPTYALAHWVVLIIKFFGI